MSIRTTLALLGIAVLLTVYVAIFEAPRSPFEPGRVFPDVGGPSDFRKLEITRKIPRGDGAEAETVRIFLRRTGEYEWWLEEPFRFRGFLPRIQGLLWTLEGLRRIDRIEPGSEAHARWAGDSGPEITVRFQTVTGAEHTVEIGRDYSDSRLQYLYVRLDGEEVMAAPRAVRGELAVGVDDVRSRALFPIAPPDALSLTVDAPSEIERKSIARPNIFRGWRFAAPPELEGTLADPDLVQELLLELNAWKVVTFALDNFPEGQDLSPYGLAEPRYQVHGRHQNGSEVHLDVGKRVSEGEESPVYVRRRGEPFIFAAEPGPLRWLGEERDALRTRYVFDFQEARVESLQCEGPLGSFSLYRKEISRDERGQGRAPDAPVDEIWMVRSGDGLLELEGDRSVIEPALGELGQLMILKFLPAAEDEADPGEFARKITVVLDRGEDSPVEESGELALRFGRKSDDPRDAEREVYEALRSTDGARLLVESLWPLRIDEGIHGLRERRISKLNPAQVYRFEMAAGERRWVIQRLPREEWTVDPPPRQGVTLDQALVNGLLRALGADAFRAAGFAADLPPSQFDLVGIGRTVFRYRIDLLLVDGKYDGFRTLRIGEPLSGNETQRRARSEDLCLALADTPDVPFLLSRQVPASAGDLVEHLREITEEP